MTAQVVGDGGFALPSIGFGTASLKGREARAAVCSALECGYRLVDSAFNYENEGAVGHAVRTSGVPREEVVVTSKLPGRHHEYGAALRAVEESLYRTGLDHIDLYLIHWPNPKRQRYVQAWEALIEARRRGLVRAIGVSNFQPAHLERLRAETGVLPAVNQIELHPYFPQRELRAYHARWGIVVEAWTPLGHGGLTEEPLVTRLAAELGVSPWQVILRWHRQLGVVALPRSTDPSHQRQNIALDGFELTAGQMARLSGLGRADGRINGQDPDVYEEF
jgi:diketogulonate reductase-like aldo/keto reductase